jgi:hypothetical protein
MNNGKSGFILAALSSYLNYDGQGSQVGSTSVAASSSDVSKATVYAMLGAAGDNSVYIIAINKSSTALSAQIQINSPPTALSSGKAYQLTSATNTSLGHAPVDSGLTLSVAGAALTYVMPAMSVSTLVIK